MIKHKFSQGNAVVIIIVIVVGLIIAGTLGYTLWNNTNKQSVTEEQTPPITEDKKDTTLTLPNGKTATYPDTEGNGNITFSSANNSDANDVYVKISHKAFQEFLATVSQSVITDLCGTDSDLKAIKTDIIVGLLNTDTKVITPPQNQNCVDVIASVENSDVSLRTEAQSTLDQINSDIDAFLQSVVIK